MKIVGTNARTVWKHLGMGLVTLLLVACRPSEFQRQHDRAVRENPYGVKLEIRTRGDQRTFAPSEIMPFEAFYTAKFPGEWHIEILEGVNEPASRDFFYLSDGKSIWREFPQYRGIFCCYSRHVWLSLDPVRLPYKLGPNQRYDFVGNRDWYEFRLPSKPGKYQIYVTSQRVFGREYKTLTYSGKGIAVSSNILSIEVK